MTEHGDSGAFS